MTSAGSGPKDPSVRSLVASAGKWIRRALDAWIEDDGEAVALLAPIAVEHLGKAVLWHANPALLVEIRNGREESLFKLAGATPDIRDPDIRTIGFAQVLDRLEKLLGKPTFPLDQRDKDKLVQIRNGSVHVGVRGVSATALQDSLRLCAALLTALDLTPEQFYGPAAVQADEILAARQSELRERVLRKMAGARKIVEQLTGAVGEDRAAELLDDIEAELEAGADSGGPIATTDYGAQLRRRCPACGRGSGRLVGDVQAEREYQVFTNMEDGTKSEELVTHVLFEPQAFHCGVCKLTLEGLAEISLGGVEISYELDDTESWSLWDYMKACDLDTDEWAGGR